MVLENGSHALIARVIDILEARFPKFWLLLLLIGLFVALPVIVVAQNWDQVLAAAKQEGSVVVYTTGGQLAQQALMTFQKRFPYIRLELFGAVSAEDIMPRMTAERKAGRYLWDVYKAGAEGLTLLLKPAGFLDPITDALMPEVLDDSKWFGGFNDGWKDKEKKFAYGLQGDVSNHVWVNRDFVPVDKLKTIEELIEPRWKGQIAWRDPTHAFGAGGAHSGYMLAAKGEKFFRDLIAQTGSYSRDQRQVAEWLVRGRYPIVFALSSYALEPFWDSGVAKNVKPLSWGSTDVPARITAGTAVAGLINRAPHPNAARVFLSWLFSKEGQEAWVKNMNLNSRRLDVTKISETAPRPGRKYFDINLEEHGHFPPKAAEIAKGILK
jgi:iron(III) transport system substrate-binding protein